MIGRGLENSVKVTPTVRGKSPRRYTCCVLRYIKLSGIYYGMSKEWAVLYGRRELVSEVRSPPLTAFSSGPNFARQVFFFSHVHGPRRAERTRARRSQNSALLGQKVSSPKTVKISFDTLCAKINPFLRVYEKLSFSCSYLRVIIANGKLLAVTD